MVIYKANLALVTSETLQQTCQETEYRPDICWATEVEHSENFLPMS